MPGLPSFSYGGQTYNTVQIGNQCWMKENLNYATGNSWCYDNDPANCNIYGRLYDWNTALNACPPGWHLPSDTEWTMLTDFLGGEEVAGGKLKATTHWPSPNTGATNSSGFTGLPGGDRSQWGTFLEMGFYGSWWSSTESEYSTTRAWFRILLYNHADMNSSDLHKGNGFSVRCIKD
ncbi:MAG TPA: fibrobacter succinogenes major paralogous domain-containing protein [Lentimicrobium sp.]|nr:fibrobacter succinogenes major paralogous domain-containing protein [Lentimicrobium sp.]